MNMSMTSTRSPVAMARVDLGARQAVTLASVAMAVVAILDVIPDGRLGSLFSVGFILIAVTTPLAVEVHSLFAPGIMPPLLMIGAILVLAIVLPDSIQANGLAASDGVMQRLIAGIINNATALVVGHLLALAVIALRIVTDPDKDMARSTN